MFVKAIVYDDFVNYKKPSMFIATCFCNWKCCREGGFDISTCQNSHLSKQQPINIPIKTIFERYTSNSTSKAIVIGGLEPFLQYPEVLELIKYFRKNKCNDEFVIYTGYYREEIEDKVRELSLYPNIIIKFGRYKPNNKPKADDVLGVTLASDNQYAVKIS